MLHCALSARAFETKSLSFSISAAARESTRKPSFSSSPAKAGFSFWIKSPSLPKPMECHNSSVINGINGCSKRSICLRHKSCTAKTVPRADSSAMRDFETSRYQPQKSFQKNEYKFCVMELNWYKV